MPIMTNLAAPATLSIRAIRRDGGTQPRDATNNEAIAEYAERMQAGDSFPAVTVYYDGSAYWLADGFHRIAASEAAGLTEIAAEVRQGTRRDAVLHSVGVNAEHGLRRTNADKRRAVRVLLDDPEWRQWSDREIARRCAVSVPLVGRVRAETVTVNSYSDERTYTTKHGTEAKMDVSGIGAAKAAEPAPLSLVPDEPEPDDEDAFGEVDVIAELERAHEELRDTQMLVDSLKATDQGREIAQWAHKYAQLEGRLRQVVTESNEAKKQATYQGKLLRQIRETLGVESNGEILNALMARAA